MNGTYKDRSNLLRSRYRSTNQPAEAKHQPLEVDFQIRQRKIPSISLGGSQPVHSRFALPGVQMGLGEYPYAVAHEEADDDASSRSHPIQETGSGNPEFKRSSGVGPVPGGAHRRNGTRLRHPIPNATRKRGMDARNHHHREEETRREAGGRTPVRDLPPRNSSSRAKCFRTYRAETSGCG